MDRDIHDSMANARRIEEEGPDTIAEKDLLAMYLHLRTLDKEIEQILGQALGYPWYKDDPKNFPDATEADGVCTPFDAWNLAWQAAEKLKDLKNQVDRLEANLKHGLKMSVAYKMGYDDAIKERGDMTR